MTTTPRIISFGIVDGDPIFMDLRSDSYFALDPSLAPGFTERLASGGAELCDLRQAFGLDGEEAEIARADAPQASASLLDTKRRRARLSDVARLFYCLLRAKLSLRFTSIETALSTACNGELPRKSRGADDAELVIATERFLAARPLVPIKANCLSDSLALLLWLDRRCADVDLVFGAKLHPFAAHCWLQVDALILNDRIETVSAFTPVRVERCSSVTR